MAKNKGRRRKKTKPDPGYDPDPVVVNTQPDPNVELARLKAAMEAEQKAIKTFLEDPKNEDIKALGEDLAEHGKTSIIEDNSDIQQGSSITYPEGGGKGLILKIVSRQDSKDKSVLRAFFAIDPDVPEGDRGEIADELAVAISTVRDHAIDPEKLFSFTVEIKTAPDKKTEPKDKLEEYLKTLPGEARAAAEILLAEVPLDPEEIKQAVKILNLQFEKGDPKKDLSVLLDLGGDRRHRVFINNSKDKNPGVYDVVMVDVGARFAHAEIASDYDKEFSQRILDADFPLAEIASIRAELVDELDKEPSDRALSARDLKRKIDAYRRIGGLLNLPKELDLDINAKPTRLYEEPPSPEEIARRKTIAEAEEALTLWYREFRDTDADGLSRWPLSFGDDEELITQSVDKKKDQATIKYRIVQEDASGATAPHPDFPDELTVTVEPEVKLDGKGVRELKREAERLQGEIKKIAKEKLITASRLAAGENISLELGTQDKLSVKVLDLQGTDYGRMVVRCQLNDSDPTLHEGLNKEYDELWVKAGQAWVSLPSLQNEFEVTLEPSNVYQEAAQLEKEIQLDATQIEKLLARYNINFGLSGGEVTAKRGETVPGDTVWDRPEWPDDRRPNLNRRYDVVVARQELDKFYVRALTRADERVRREILETIDLKQITLKIAALRHQLEYESQTERNRFAKPIQDDIKAFNEVIDLLGLEPKYKLSDEVTTLKDGKDAAQEAKDARREFDEKDEVELAVSYNREAKLTAKDPAGRNVYIDHIILPNGDYLTPDPKTWTPILDKYSVKINQVNKEKGGKIRSYGASLYLNEAEAVFNGFRNSSAKLNLEQQARGQKLDSLLAADFTPDPEEQKRAEAAHLSEIYEAVMKTLVNALNSLSAEEIKALGMEDVIEGEIQGRSSGIVGRIIDEQKDRTGTTFVMQLLNNDTPEFFKNYLGTAKKLFKRLEDFGLLRSGSYGLKSFEAEFIFKVKDGKVVEHSYTDLDQLLVDKGIVNKTRAQEWAEKYDAATSYAEKNYILSEIKDELIIFRNQVETARNKYINSGTGDLDQVATEIRESMAQYNELKDLEQELRGRNVRQARIATLELATPKQRQSLLESRSPEEYERRFADIVRKTWLRWAYEAKSYDGNDVDLKSDRDLDSKGLEILIFAGFNPKDLKMEPLASGESKPGYFMYDTGYAAGFEHRGDVDAAPLGATVKDYQLLADHLGIAPEEAEALYPGPKQGVAPDRTVICDHHAQGSPTDSSSAEILYNVLRDLKVIDGSTIKKALSRTEYIGKGADKINDQEAELIFGKAVKFVSYADSFSHPKMADSDWYKESYKTLLGLYKAGRLDFFDVLLYFYNNRENQSADGTEEIPMTELQRYPTKDREKTIYESEKRRLRDPRFNPQKKPNRENNPIDAYHIVKSTVEESQQQIEVLERNGLIVDTDLDGPARGMKLVIDLGGENLRGAAAAAYGLRQAAFLSWCGLDKKTKLHRKGFFLSAPKGNLGESSVLTSNSEVVRGQMAVLLDQTKPLTPEFLRHVLEDLGVPSEQIARVIEQVPEFEEHKMTKGELAIDHARQRIEGELLPKFRDAHRLIAAFVDRRYPSDQHSDETRKAVYDKMLEGIIDKIRAQYPKLNDQTIDRIREQIETS